MDGSDGALAFSLQNQHSPRRSISTLGWRERESGEGGVERGDGGRMGREVAESCVDGVIIEMVSAYCKRFYGTKPELAARRIEAIGYQVGHQLIERLPSNSSLVANFDIFLSSDLL
ncbi:hypothetical protein B296_00039288 [Ensete ventricosum]|uniref:Uncharacterized protein n=1 Tax=Ensete ventricosum TaxID=4639 RepID=A0A426Z775_ENSVE|nr:hypothetical protein B296_00039288 [Ensete ventricosum]